MKLYFPGNVQRNPKTYQQALDAFIKEGAIEVRNIACVIKWPSASSTLTLFKAEHEDHEQAIYFSSFSNYRLFSFLFFSFLFFFFLRRSNYRLIV